MLFDILEDTSLSVKEKIVLLVILPVVILVSLVLHECAHALASYAQGDGTAKRMGRLSLNPLKHLSLVGTLCMFFCGFGWAKPVPVDPRYYKDAKKGMAITALAGPCANLAIGISSLGFYSVLEFLFETGYVTAFPVIGNLPDIAYFALFNFLFVLYYYNLLLAVFNLFPVPPLDGSRLMLSFLPAKTYFGIMKYEKIIMVIMFLLLWTGRLSFIFEALVSLIEFVVRTSVFKILGIICNFL